MPSSASSVTRKQSQSPAPSTADAPFLDHDAQTHSWPYEKMVTCRDDLSVHARSPGISPRHLGCPCRVFDCVRGVAQQFCDGAAWLHGSEARLRSRVISDGDAATTPSRSFARGRIPPGPESCRDRAKARRHPVPIWRDEPFGLRLFRSGSVRLCASRCLASAQRRAAVPARHAGLPRPSRARRPGLLRWPSPQWDLRRPRPFYPRQADRQASSHREPRRQLVRRALGWRATTLADCVGRDSEADDSGVEPAHSCP